MTGAKIVIHVIRAFNVPVREGVLENTFESQYFKTNNITDDILLNEGRSSVGASDKVTFLLDFCLLIKGIGGGGVFENPVNKFIKFTIT